MGEIKPIFEGLGGNYHLKLYERQPIVVLRAEDWELTKQFQKMALDLISLILHEPGGATDKEIFEKVLSLEQKGVMPSDAASDRLHVHDVSDGQSNAVTGAHRAVEETSERKPTWEPGMVLVHYADGDWRIRLNSKLVQS